MTSPPGHRTTRNTREISRGVIRAGVNARSNARPRPPTDRFSGWRIRHCRRAIVARRLSPGARARASTDLFALPYPPSFARLTARLTACTTPWTVPRRGGILCVSPGPWRGRYRRNPRTRAPRRRLVFVCRGRVPETRNTARRRRVCRARARRPRSPPSPGRGAFPPKRRTSPIDDPRDRSRPPKTPPRRVRTRRGFPGGGAVFRGTRVRGLGAAVNASTSSPVLTNTRSRCARLRRVSSSSATRAPTAPRARARPTRAFPRPRRRLAFADCATRFSAEATATPVAGPRGRTAIRAGREARTTAFLPARDIRHRAPTRRERPARRDPIRLLVAASFLPRSVASRSARAHPAAAATSGSSLDSRRNVRTNQSAKIRSLSCLDARVSEACGSSGSNSRAVARLDRRRASRRPAATEAISPGVASCRFAQFGSPHAPFTTNDLHRRATDVPRFPRRGDWPGSGSGGGGVDVVRVRVRVRVRRPPRPSPLRTRRAFGTSAAAAGTVTSMCPSGTEAW